MKIKLLFLAVTLLFVSTLSAQSFFGRIPKPERSNLFGLTATSTDSVINAIRPITNIAAYSLPGNILMAGAGVSYQHLTYNYTTQSWYCNYSVSAMGWAGGSVAPTNQAEIVSYGIMVGLFNNLVMIGPALNGNKLNVTVGIGINLN
jgi:hypothetical protein